MVPVSSLFSLSGLARECECLAVFRIHEAVSVAGSVGSDEWMTVDETDISRNSRCGRCLAIENVRIFGDRAIIAAKLHAPAGVQLPVFDGGVCGAFTSARIAHARRVHGGAADHRQFAALHILGRHRRKPHGRHHNPGADQTADKNRQNGKRNHERIPFGAQLDARRLAKMDRRVQGRSPQLRLNGDTIPLVIPVLG